MLDYAGLAALAAVIREGGFDRAAAALGVTPSAVSQRVRGLEERVGAVLVVRGQPPAPTEAGARLCAHVERVRLLEAELARGAPDLALRLGGTAAARLRVAVNADSLAAWFPAAAAAFAAETGATLDLALDHEGRTLDRLRAGEVLAAVTSETRPAPGCRRRSLGALRYVATAAPGFAARWFPDGPTAAALGAAPVLRFDRHDGLQARWARRVAGVVIDGAPTHWAPSTQAFLDLTCAGLGWSLNPEALAAPHLAAGRLVALAPDAPIDVPLVWQRARLGSALLDALTRAVTEAARRSLRPVG
jgi:LysR family transcriptional regulator (chromosome initiation inhibitor)